MYGDEKEGLVVCEHDSSDDSDDDDKNTSEEHETVSSIKIKYLKYNLRQKFCQRLYDNTHLSGHCFGKLQHVDAPLPVGLDDYRHQTGRKCRQCMVWRRLLQVPPLSVSRKTYK